MSETLNDLILDSLRQPVPAIGYYLSGRLHTLYPDMAIVEGHTPAFNVEEYAKAGHCELRERPVPQPERILHWVGHTEPQIDRAHNAFFDVLWEGERLHVLIMHWFDQSMPPYRYSIVARSREVAEHFHAAVCVWNTPEPDEYIMLFDMGGWQKDQALLDAIKNATLDNLVLRGTLKDDILRDIRSFFAARPLRPQVSL
jgi:hypothetical protein